MDDTSKIPSIKSFLEEIKGYNPKANLSLIKKAFETAKKAHKGQKRDSGKPYFTHPVEVCKILMELKADSATICAALLHDIIENTKITYEMIEKVFGKEISSLVEGLTKSEEVKFNSREEYTNENLRKVLLASAKDIRIILIKLADRLHNMRTLKYKLPEKRKEIAQVTMDIFAPIAEKLGLWSIKGELEDYSLRFLDPEAYQLLKQKIGEKRAEREKKAKEIVDIIQNELDKNKIKAKVFGRAKYFYSIYKKMKKKGKDFSDILDLIGIRVITTNKDDCYAVLNIMHNMWPYKKSRLKDYIQYPKDNGYQSIHTTVYGPFNKMLEIQIRDLKMHYEAEGGVAAHWKYIGTERDKEFDRRIQWFKQAIEWRSFSKNAKEFLENLRMDFYENEIVVLTPKGDPITLKDGSTPLDFAYEVHTSIGNHCYAVQVNGKAVPLDYKLKSGEIITIITRNNVKPSSSWLKIVQTNHAKNKIRHALGLVKTPSVNKSLVEKSKLSNKVEIKDPSIKGAIKIQECCNPRLNDPIIGFFNKESNQISIHKFECPKINIFEKSQRIDVSWQTKDKEKKLLNLRVKVRDRVGLLSEILNLFSENNIKPESVNSKVSKEYVYISFIVERINPEKEKEIAIKLKRIPEVISIFME
jgi:GTP pyrophosphokinase